MGSHDVPQQILFSVERGSLSEFTPKHGEVSSHTEDRQFLEMLPLTFSFVFDSILVRTHRGDFQLSYETPLSSLDWEESRHTT